MEIKNLPFRQENPFAKTPCPKRSGGPLLRTVVTSRVSVTFLFVSIVLSSLAVCGNLFAQTIIYPGTFDPFHQTHLAELKGAIKLKNAKTVLVLPIEAAYYAEAKGIPFPKLFPHQLRLRLIDECLAAESINGSASAALKTIGSNVFERLIEVQETIKDREQYILVGTDVLKTWEKLPNFSSFLVNIRLLVSADPYDQKSTDDLKERYAGSQHIEFVDFELAGERAADIKLRLFGENLNTTGLPDSTAKFLKANPEIMAVLADRLKKQMHEYFSNQMLELLIQDKTVSKLASNTGDEQKDYFLFYREVYEPLEHWQSPSHEGRLKAKFGSENFYLLKQFRNNSAVREILDRNQRSIQLLDVVSNYLATGTRSLNECRRLNGSYASDFKMCAHAQSIDPPRISLLHFSFDLILGGFT